MEFKLAALLVCLWLGLAGQALCALDGRDTTQLWENFKVKYGKVYENEQVEQQRRQVFERNLQRIDDIKRQTVTVRSQNGSVVHQAPSFDVGINHLADLTEEEYSEINGFRLPTKAWECLRDTIQDKIKSVRCWWSGFAYDKKKSDMFIGKVLRNLSQIPDAVDWSQDSARVSSVKDQGRCGSCWAFALTGMLEGQQQVRLNRTSGSANVTDLSPQNLVDCDVWNLGCRGGDPLRALSFVHKQGGINSWDSYPYVSGSGSAKPQCQFKKDSSIMSIQGVAKAPKGDEWILKHIVAKYGPVAVAVDAHTSSFMFYRKGIFSSGSCRNDVSSLNHAVLLVGYGTDEHAGDYWIIKNSWGVWWGDAGYMKIARMRDNMCGIGTYATLAIF